MFKRPGKKIKTLAIILFIFLCLVPVVLGILLMAGALGGSLGGSLSGSAGVSGTVLGILVILLGLASAWISTILLFAFGELTDDIHAIREAELRLVALNEARDTREKLRLQKEYEEQQKLLREKELGLNRTTPSI